MLPCSPMHMIPSSNEGMMQRICQQPIQHQSWYSCWSFLLVVLLTTIPKGVTCNGFLQICPALVNVPILTVGLDSNTGTFYYVGMAVYQKTGGGAITTYHDAANHTRQRRRRLQYTNTQQQQRQNTKSHIPDFPPASSQSVVASLNRLRQHVAASLHNTSAQNLSNASMYYVGGNTTTTSNNSSSGSDAGDTSSDQIFYVRECGCFPPSQELTHRFCPAVFDTCGIPSDAFSAAHNRNSVPVACFMAQTLHEEILRTAWPIFLVWIAIVAGVCCFTDLSMDARHYVVRLCCCRRSMDDMVDRILHAPLESRWRRRRQAFLNSYLVEVGLHQPIAVTNIPPPPPLPPQQIPTALELKTKRYKAPLRMVGGGERDNPNGNHEYDNRDDEDDDGHDEAVSCTICFHPLEDGDRIGDLECVHTFHVECLKSWLSRRNTCPLCQAANVATMRFEAPPQQPASVTDNPVNAAANAATAPEPIVPTQVSPFINPFSSSVTRQQVIRNLEVRRLTRQAAADAPSAASTTNVAPTQQLRRGRDSFRGVTILPQR